MLSQPKIILASQSPQRREVLVNAGFQPELVNPPYIEEFDPNLSPDQLARKHASGKAQSIANNYQSGIIIGVDTLINLNGRIIEKPKDASHAKEIIQSQQGQTLEVVSGLSMIDASKKLNLITHEVTKVTFHKMTEAEIDYYIATNEWQDKSGAFAIQGIGSRFIKKVEGDFLSVVGLPMQQIYQVMKKWGYASQ